MSFDTLSSTDITSLFKWHLLGKRGSYSVSISTFAFCLKPISSLNNYLQNTIFDTFPSVFVQMPTNSIPLYQSPTVSNSSTFVQTPNLVNFKGVHSAKTETMQVFLSMDNVYNTANDSSIIPLAQLILHHQC